MVDIMETASAFASLGAVAQRSRIDILTLLVEAGEDGLQVGYIGEQLGLKSANLSRHLHRLLRAGLISQRREGRHFIYAINPGASKILLGAVASVFGHTSGDPVRDRIGVA
jgi:ArsR family transcriptional regulator, arsenate/arsenite/antimonite-responsive transcriptional repressor